MKRNVGKKQAKARAARREKKQVKAGELKRGGRRPDPEVEVNTGVGIEVFVTKPGEWSTPGPRHGPYAFLAAKAHAALGNLGPWAHRCHEASLALVKAGVGDRVARGACTGVGGQHSWVVVGMDCYDDDAVIIDPTLWSYDGSVKGIWIGTMASGGKHRPHGYGNIWSWGQPQGGGGTTIRLTPRTPFSKIASSFLDLLGPLDALGWQRLASHAPVVGWPAGEILAAIEDTPQLKCVVPVDRIGMLTQRNPGGLYLRV